MAADGSIVISVDADDKQAQERLNDLKRQIEQMSREQAKSQKDIATAERNREKINERLLKQQEKLTSLNAELSAAESRRNPLIEQAEQYQSDMATYKKEMDEYRQAWFSGSVGADRDLSASQEKLLGVKSQYEDLLKIIEKEDSAISSANEKVDKQANIVQALTEELKQANTQVDNSKSLYEEIGNKINNLKTEAGELSAQLVEVGNNGKTAGKNMANGSKEADTAFGRLQGRIIGLAKRVFVFSLITSGLRSVRDWIRNTIMADSEATVAIARLKGAFLTLVQPLLQVVIPAFVKFVNILTQIVSAIASVISALFGTTVQDSAKAAKQQLYGEQKAIKGVGEAAKKASKSLLSFDEINKLEGSDDFGTSGGVADAGGDAGEIAPDFSFIDSGISKRLQEIAKWVFLIGVGFATWKIAENIDGPLGELIKKISGLAIAIGGVMIFIHGFTDALNNGVNWPNLIEMVGGLAAAAAGLYILLGPIAAGIALVAGGIGVLVISFQDAIKNGLDLQNTFLAIAGILATGLGFFFITGSVIPLVIGAIFSLLTAVTIATGRGEELINGIRDILEGFIDFFTGIFSGDIEKAVGGIENVFEGLKKAIHAVIDGIKDFFVSFLDWLDKKTDGKFNNIIEGAKKIVHGFFDATKKVADDVIDVLKGIVKFIAGVFTVDFDLAWEGVKDVFKNILNALLDIGGSVINLFIGALNFLIEKINTISFDVPDWVPGVGGNKIGVNIPKIASYEVPHLAKGAVIPPNREFMAVLGDQTSGNNIEAPESLLHQMAAEAASVNTPFLQEIIQLMRDGKVMVVNDTTFAELVYRSNASARNRHGGSLVSIMSR